MGRSNVPKKIEMLLKSCDIFLNMRDQVTFFRVTTMCTR